MKEYKDIRDDQIRIIGEQDKKSPWSRNLWFVTLSILGIVIIGVFTYLFLLKKDEDIQEPELAEPALFEPIRKNNPIRYQRIGSNVDSLKQGFTEIVDTLINDIPIKIFIPHNAVLSLHVGRMDKNDKSIIYAAQAADVRADNGGIVGAFVLEGEPLARGLSKKGYCASINGIVTIGVADNSPLFEKATEENGYFFRQYPLVSNGEVIDNEPKGKSIRRAICDRQGEIFMVETGTAESFHDFAQALSDLGVDHAVYLVGSSAYGWAVDASNNIYEFGEDNYYKGRRKMPKNTNYIVWKRK